jgi:hypothetical protein
VHEHVIMGPQGEWLRARDTRDRRLATQRGHDADTPGPFRPSMSWHSERESEQREGPDSAPCVQGILLQPDHNQARVQQSVCERPAVGWARDVPVVSVRAKSLKDFRCFLADTPERGGGLAKTGT